jgi:glycosyltransferase involved in cell wall biosynthesis
MHKSAQLSVSIIICTRNRAESLRATLASLGQVNLPCGWQVELILVDNGSTDNTSQILLQTPLSGIRNRYVFEPQKGLSIARNRGVKESSGDVLLFTDDDMRFPKGWIEYMCMPIMEGKADAVAGRIDIPPHLRRSWMGSVHLGWLGVNADDLREPAVLELTGGNFAVKRAVLGPNTCFDEALGAGGLGFGEEVLLSRQLQRQGFRICTASICVEHHFDELHLLRQNWLRDARQRGASAAYIDYHWEHTGNPSVWKLMLAALRYVACWIINPRWQNWREGADPTQLQLLLRLHYRLQMWRMRRQPRRYAQLPSNCRSLLVGDVLPLSSERDNGQLSLGCERPTRDGKQ